MSEGKKKKKKKTELLRELFQIAEYQRYSKSPALGRR